MSNARGFKKLTVIEIDEKNGVTIRRVQAALDPRRLRFTPP